MNITSTNEQKVPVKLEPKTIGGQPAQVDGPVLWETLEGDATFDFPGEGLEGFIVSGTAVGHSQVKATADADMGAGVRHIEIIFDYEVTAAGAETFGVVIGDAVPK